MKVTSAVLGMALMASVANAASVERQGVPLLDYHDGNGGCFLFHLPNDADTYAVWLNPDDPVTGIVKRDPVTGTPVVRLGPLSQITAILLAAYNGQEVSFAIDTTRVATCHNGAQGYVINDLDGR